MNRCKITRYSKSFLGSGAKTLAFCVPWTSWNLDSESVTADLHEAASPGHHEIYIQSLWPQTFTKLCPLDIMKSTFRVCDCRPSRSCVPWTSWNLHSESVTADLHEAVSPGHHEIYIQSLWPQTFMKLRPLDIMKSTFRVCDRRPSWSCVPWTSWNLHSESVTADHHEAQTQCWSCQVI